MDMIPKIALLLSPFSCPLKETGELYKNWGPPSLRSRAANDETRTGREGHLHIRSKYHYHPSNTMIHRYFKLAFGFPFVFCFYGASSDISINREHLESHSSCQCHSCTIALSNLNRWHHLRAWKQDDSCHSLSLSPSFCSS